MISELFIGLLVGAGAVGVLVLGGFVFSIKKIKKIKSEIRELKTAVIAHEKHLYGTDKATDLAFRTGQIKNVKKQVKVNDKKASHKEAISQLTNCL